MAKVRFTTIKTASIYEKVKKLMENKFKLRKTSFFHHLLLPLYILASVLYLIWRFNVSNIWNTWYAYPLLVFETYSVILTLLYFITSKKIMYPVWVPPLKNKTVDVLIPTFNEPDYVIKATAIGALNIDGVRNVIVLDDGNRSEIKYMVSRIGAKYFARGENKHAKAGNMNFGLKHTDAEFLICLDCDHVPQKEFINRTLGYFRDPKLAFVQTPQLFYNTDSIQFRRLNYRNYWNEQSMFYESIQPSKNTFNASFFCGSNALLRRAAIDSIGGFATGTATEDIHTSLRLHAKGWNSLFVKEPLAYGIAPEDLKEYHKQRLRWGAGSLGLLFRSSDSPLLAKGLSLMQRLCYFNSTIFFLNGIQKLLYFLLPVSILLSLPFTYEKVFVPVLSNLLIFFAFWGLSYIVAYIYSDRTFQPIYTEQFNIANMFSSLMALKGIVQVQKKFSVSVKIKSGKEKSAAYIFIVFIWVLMIATNIFGLVYWFMYLGNSLNVILSDMIGIVLFWNSFNLIFVWFFIHYLAKYNNKIKKNPIVPNNLSSKILSNVDGIKKVAIAVVDTIGFCGASIISNNCPGEKDIEITFDFDMRKLSLPVKVNSCELLKSGRCLCNISFNELSTSQEIDLALFLFHKIVPGIFQEDFI